MAGSLDLQAKLTLATQDAEASLDRVQGGLKSVEAAGKKAGKGADETKGSIRNMGRAGVQHIGAVKEWFMRAAVAAQAAAAATVQALNAIKAVGDAVNAQQAMSPVDNAAIEAANQALGGTVDQLTLIKTLQNSNLSTDKFEDAAKSAAFLAKQFGFSKAHMLDAVHNGTLMETQLQALGISSKHLDNEVAKIAMSMGGVGGEVDDVTKANIKAKVTIDAIRRASKGWKSDTRQAGDAAAKVLAEFKNVAHELGKEILPTLNRIIKAMIDAAKWAAKWKRALQEQREGELKDMAKGVAVAAKWKKYLTAQKSVVAQDKKRAHSQAEIKTGLAAIFATAKKYLPVAKAIGGIVKDQAKAGLKAAETAGKAIAAEKAKAKALANQKRIREELRRQAIEEARQLQEQAKDLVRNYSEKIAQVVADQGGSFGEVASGLTDALEKGRIFASTSFGRKGLAAATKVAAMFQGRMNVDLMKEVELRKKSLGLDGKKNRKALHAAKLMAGWIQGNAKDTAEYLGNEKLANVELRAGLQLLQGQGKLAGIRKEQNNAFKDIAQFQNSAETMRNSLIERRNELTKGGAEANKAEIPNLNVMIQRLGLTIQRYQAVGDERRKILAIAEKHAKIELQVEKSAARSARAAAQLAGRRSIEDARVGLAGVSGIPDAAGGFRRAGGRQSEDLQIEIRRLKAENQTKALKLMAGGLNVDSQQKLINEAKQNEILMEQARTKLGLVHQTTAAQIEGLTLAGQLQKQFAHDGVAMAAQMASMAKSSFDSLVGGFAESIGNVVSAAVQGDEDMGAQFGKSTLEALGSLAMQWGSFFMIQGAGMLAGLNPMGAAVLAAGGGMMVLGGVLKGAGGLIGGKPKKANAAGNTQFQDRIPGTKTDDPKNVRETYILVNDVPWRGRGQARDFSEMIAWTKQGQRMTGKRLAGV